MTQKHFISLATLNFQKHETDKTDLVFVWNSFVAKYNEMYCVYGKFSKNDFIQM